MNHRRYHYTSVKRRVAVKSYDTPNFCCMTGRTTEEFRFLFFEGGKAETNTTVNVTLPCTGGEKEGFIYLKVAETVIQTSPTPRMGKRCQPSAHRY